MSVVAEQAGAFRTIAEDLGFDVDDLDPQEVVDHIGRLWADLPGILDARDAATKRAERAEAACAAMREHLIEAEAALDFSQACIDNDHNRDIALNRLAGIRSKIGSDSPGQPLLDELERLRGEHGPTWHHIDNKLPPLGDIQGQPVSNGDMCLASDGVEVHRFRFVKDYGYGHEWVSAGLVVAASKYPYWTPAHNTPPTAIEMQAAREAGKGE